MMWCKGNPNLNVFDSSSNCVSAVRRANVTSMKLGNSEDKPNRDVVVTLLPKFSNGNLRKADEFSEALDQIELALAVDGAFEGTTIEARLD